MFFEQDAPYFIGLDISVTGTGLVVLDKELYQVAAVCIESKPMPDWYQRVNMILDRVKLYMPIDRKVNAALFVEDYAYAAKGQVFNIAELSGIIKFHIARVWNIPFLKIPPTTLKKFTTGTGTAPKELMMKEVYKRYGMDYNNNNIADAYALARMGYALTMGARVPVYQETAIKKVWSDNKTTQKEWEDKTVNKWGM